MRVIRVLNLHYWVDPLPIVSTVTVWSKDADTTTEWCYKHQECHQDKWNRRQSGHGLTYGSTLAVVIKQFNATVFSALYRGRQIDNECFEIGISLLSEGERLAVWYIDVELDDVESGCNAREVSVTLVVLRRPEEWCPAEIVV